ncbi:MAG: hypothetical protein HY072_04770 [Deltaproteobacteria bacterium]|nr:hypothetical protein [Deltaproteobacteria bacterium]
MAINKTSKPLEKHIENALLFGSFIAWNETSMFCNELSRTLAEVTEYAEKNPQEGLGLLELFMGGCLTKAQEIDDSDGDLGMFMDDLILTWTRCCEAASMIGEEFVRKLAHWEKVDDIGYCSDIETKVIPALSKRFASALESTLLKRLETPESKKLDQYKTDYKYRSTVSTIKKLYASTKNINALINFCEKYEIDDADCLSIATIFHEKKQFYDALRWADKGLALISNRSSKEYELKTLRRKILADSGRNDEALEDAWAEFIKHPSKYSLETVFEFVPPQKNSFYKDKALVILDKININESCVAFLSLGELERLDNKISQASEKELEDIFYGEAISMAKTMSKNFPHSAARIYVAQALRILHEKRSKAYYHAHDYLEKAKDLFEKCGKEDLWTKTVSNIRTEHKLKSSFMPGFEQIVAGKGAPREPTFMERIASKLDKDL